MTYNPDFDIDRVYGEHAEKDLRSLLGLNGDSIEVKHKRYVDARFYVEVAQSPGATGQYKPSGINTTRATYWAYAIADTGIVVLVPTSLLKEAARGARQVEESDGDNPTKGRLVGLTDIFFAHERQDDQL